ncbi:MAG: outer membrane beta-barrel protein [Chloracidobacterium sp.]|nr:outer membrane beta-barrel protein [Chloracidobacterium sp.]
MNSELRKKAPHFPRIRRAIATGAINRMDTHNRSFLFMFLSLTYSLFRRPASAAPKRLLPTDHNYQTGRPVNLKSEAPTNKSTQSSRRNGDSMSFLRGLAPGLALIPFLGVFATAQYPTGAQERLASDVSKSGREDKEGKRDGAAANERTKNGKDNAELMEEMRQMRQLIERLEARVNQLEAEKSAVAVKPAPYAVEAPDAAAAPRVTPATTRTGGQTGALQEGDRKALDFFRGTTISGTVDTYYGYNFNRPVGRVNLLRAYDVSSDSFSLNQAVVSVERAPDVDAGRRFGMRLDLMYGQATETLQGNAANEPRPQVFRPLWQVYGTYVAPIGNGLTLDFGKFASSLGYETNFTKDDFNYSRSYFFNFLPFYHFGLRAKYPVNDKLAALYHVMNGAQQSEDFNGFKSQQVAAILTPSKKVTWQVNYYFGREQRDLAPQLNPTFAIAPTQPGLSTDIIVPTPRGRFHALDSYVTWLVTDRLTLAAEADYVINRVQEFSPPSHVTGGVAYARYQFAPKFALAGRAEYLSDRGGLFSGVTQALKETTFTADYKLADGLLMRGEWRRDFSNRRFFLTDAPGVLKKDQQTATLGLVWWFGKEGGW